MSAGILLYSEFLFVIVVLNSCQVFICPLVILGIWLLHHHHLEILIYYHHFCSFKRYWQPSFSINSSSSAHYVPDYMREFCRIKLNCCCLLHYLSFQISLFVLRYQEATCFEPNSNIKTYTKLKIQNLIVFKLLSRI